VLAALSKATRLVEIVTGWVVAVIVLFLVAVVVGQLVDRHAIDLPIHAPDQFARVGIIWLTFLGFALAVHDGSSIRVDLIDHWLPERARQIMAIVSDVVMLAMSAWIAFKGWAVVEVGAGQYLLGTPFTAALPNTGLFIGAILTVVFIAARLCGRLLPADTGPR
jgi:TRAP-type transport system small permease protein